MKALLVYPTHSNLREELDRYLAAGVDVAVYPPRTTTGTETTAINCWNSEADQAEAVGFPVGKTVCFRCPQREHCLQHGYLQQILAAEQASVALATHARLEHSGFDELGRDRDWISIHENPINLLSPTVTIRTADLNAVRLYIHTLLSNPRWLDWFAEGTSRDHAGNTYLDEQKRVQRDRYFQTSLILADLLDDLDRAVTTVQQTTEWEPVETIAIPQGYEGFLWWSSRAEQLQVKHSPWKFLLPALRGKLRRTTIVVSERQITGMAPGAVKLIKTVLGVRENLPLAGIPIWFSDATLTKVRLEALLGCDVIDGTPSGRIGNKKFRFQYVRDITRQTSIDVTVSLIRGVLARHRHYQRIGIITHRPQLKALDQLEPLFRSRIVRRSYFGSGEERSSNVWYRECDLILILGTPRVAPQAVREYLIQVGQREIACTEPIWDEIQWQALTHRGEVKTFSGRGYYQDHWRTAHRELVRAMLIQAIGRARAVLEEGCDVIVLSNEECGLTVIDDDVPRMSDSAMEVWKQIQQLTMEKSIRDSIENTIVSTSEIAQRLSLSEVHVRELLRTLESFHMVHRAGPRSGWQLSPPPASPSSAILDPPAEPSCPQSLITT
jgi:hypothetical protein